MSLILKKKDLLSEISISLHGQQRLGKGKELKNLTYQPLFPYVQNSQIDAQYKDQFFQLLSGDFVTTEDGTGIVHIAPSF